MAHRADQAVASQGAVDHRVVGAAVKGEAARTLVAATGIECETVAWYLAHTDPDDWGVEGPVVQRGRLVDHEHGSGIERGPGTPSDGHPDREIA